MLEKKVKRIRRHKRVRAKVSGTGKRPRLCVFKSQKHIYGQLIDDDKGKTLAQASDLELAVLKKSEKQGKMNIALEVGKLIAGKAKDLKIEKVVFDRGGYKFHGKIKSLAEGAREGGLKF
ncbi:MAG: 50S ribosomal protein L18 [Candidatus Nealsonbacteria bacterium CG_4_10_14_0_2_um_filter_40_15]|uniref:Large ribosomal subunit protein uL18 n=2 Tax=Candidatus Nealsoniibacteriota TaxID=1817911 RepID=A0A2M7D8G2_9BACT|nr:MAG: 50S ribosomal protein L18 [Candidatus Nealsonbacteria bacterium CG02_land_8_20_14_3_00_40_11]PIZ87393.1 MAG: 50S ribosomal protein L18 [Candidatus Nealsonbacteria bacterium CG_4_10_14_0_2_um_filter_40_15]